MTDDERTRRRQHAAALLAEAAMLVCRLSGVAWGGRTRLVLDYETATVWIGHRAPDAAEYTVDTVVGFDPQDAETFGLPLDARPLIGPIQ